MTLLQSRPEIWRFACFALKPDRRLLLANGEPVALNARAYDMLELLVRLHDRVVTRDEIVSHVWRGRVVGDNNLSVQMSNLRRALAQHAGNEPLILNLPGQGYQLVAEVAGGLDSVSGIAPLSTRPQDQLPASRRRMLPSWLTTSVMLCAAIVLLVAGMAASMTLNSLAPTARRDPRLSIVVEPFVSVGSDQRTAALAASFTDAVLGRFGIFGDFVLFPRLQNRDSLVPAHFILGGTTQINGDVATVTVRLTDSRTGRLLFQDSQNLPVTASLAARSAAIVQLLVELRPTVFQAEAAMRIGPPRDATDLLIAAHVAAGEDKTINQLHSARSLAEQAVQRDPSNRPARALLAGLLNEEMYSQSAKFGNAKGKRALALIDSVLREDPRNFIYLDYRALILEMLGRLDEAQATAELALRLAPDYHMLTERLGEILVSKGSLREAKALLRPDPDDREGDMFVTIAFTERRYEEALERVSKDIAAAPDEWSSYFPRAIQVAALSQSGRKAAARATLTAAMDALPPDLRSISAQRQAPYGLPDDAWQRFKQGLADAGMPP